MNMKIRFASIVASGVLLTSIARGDTSLTGTFRVDGERWQSEAREALKSGAVKSSFSVEDEAKLINFLIAVAPAIEINQDGSYSMSSPFFRIHGKWVQKNGRLVATPDSSQANLPEGFIPEGFSITRANDAVRYAEKDGPSNLPMKRLNQPIHSSN